METYKMTKQFKPFGVSNVKFTDSNMARGFTYTTSDDKWPATSLAFNGNPYNDDIKNAKHILDFGCGPGRNLQWIMENTNAHYHGIDANPTMLKYFWELQDHKWKDRVSLYESFEQLDEKHTIGLRGGFSSNGQPFDGVYTLSFDVIVITFVFQHIGYRPPRDIMNISDMTQEIKKYTHEGTIWWMLEHQGEEQWYSRWKLDNNIENEVIFRNQQVIPELTHRGNHDLILWKQKEYPSRLPIQSSTIIEEE